MFDPVDVHVGSRIKMRRNLKGVSQRQLGQKLGVTFQQIQKYEKGANRIGAGRLFRIARILDVSVAFFFEEIANASPSLVGEVHEDAAPRISDGLISRYMDEASDLLRVFDEIQDQKIRHQIIQLVQVLSRSIKKQS